MGVGFNPVMIRRVEFLSASFIRVLWFQTGEQYSAVLYTRARALDLWVLTDDPVCFLLVFRNN